MHTLFRVRCFQIQDKSLLYLIRNASTLLPFLLNSTCFMFEMHKKTLMQFISLNIHSFVIVHISFYHMLFAFPEQSFEAQKSIGFMIASQNIRYLKQFYIIYQTTIWQLVYIMKFLT